MRGRSASQPEQRFPFERPRHSRQRGDNNRSRACSGLTPPVWRRPGLGAARIKIESTSEIHAYCAGHLPADYRYDIGVELAEIQRRFDCAAARYERHDALEQEVQNRLLERLDYVRRPVERALDLGCGPGRASAVLAERYPEAAVVGLDISLAMLRLRKGNTPGRAAPLTVLGDLGRLPFAARSADLVFCNLALQWSSDFGRALAEFRRVLRPEGMLLFSVPGPASLRELRYDPGAGASAEIPIYLVDLQEVGDLLVSTGFSEPVMDSERLTLRYPDFGAMTAELAVTGGAGFAKLAPPEASQGPAALSFEIVYGTAFGAPEGRPVRTAQGEIATFSVDQLRRRP